MQFVPSECRYEAAPCQQIQLNDARETVDSLYRTGTQEELEEAVGRWLTATIKRLEAQQAQSGDLNNVETSPPKLAA